MKMPELKPCPFCGGKESLFVNNGVRVLSTKCQAQTRILINGMSGTKVYGNATKSVIEAWNKRAENRDAEHGGQVDSV